MAVDPTTCILCLQKIKPRKKYDGEWIANAVELIQHQSKIIANQRKMLNAFEKKTNQLNNQGDKL